MGNPSRYKGTNEPSYRETQNSNYSSQHDIVSCSANYPELNYTKVYTNSEEKVTYLYLHPYSLHKGETRTEFTCDEPCLNKLLLKEIFSLDKDKDHLPVY